MISYDLEELTVLNFNKFYNEIKKLTQSISQYNLYTGIKWDDV